MALITGSWFIDIAVITGTLILILIQWIKKRQSYWEQKGIFTPPPSHFFLGHTKSLLTLEESNADFAKRLYDTIREKNLDYAGFYFMLSPSFMPIDPEVIKTIMQNDFSHFVDRGVFYNEDGDPLSAHLFAIEGTKWRNLRMKLTPTFTSGKMKMMFDTLVKCGDQLTEEMDKTVKDPINIKDMLIRFTTDIIGSCAFGIDCNSLKNPDNEFNKYAVSFFHRELLENLKQFLCFMFPNVMRKFNASITNPKLEKFFMNVVSDTIAYREKNNVYRKDFMHLLLQLKNRGKLVEDESIVQDQSGENEIHLTNNEIAAQAFVFFLAGFETSSTTMTFALYELASNKDIQEKVRKEVNEILAKHDGELTYAAIMEMSYLDKVINETLRKYPPLPTLNRICTKEYKLPGTDLTIEKGTRVFIPIYGLQHDERYYPEPEKFDPERFSEEVKRTRPQFAFLPFGEGPRNCIGLRFGMMQTKVGIATLLRNYRFSINNKTKVPLEMDKKSFIMAPDGGMWLDYTKLDN